MQNESQLRIHLYKGHDNFVAVRYADAVSFLFFGIFPNEYTKTLTPKRMPLPSVLSFVPRIVAVAAEGFAANDALRMLSCVSSSEMDPFCCLPV